MKRKNKTKIYCLWTTCDLFEKGKGCLHPNYICVKEIITLQEAEEKYPESKFCSDWKKEKVKTK